MLVPVQTVADIIVVQCGFFDVDDIWIWSVVGHNELPSQSCLVTVPSIDGDDDSSVGRSREGVHDGLTARVGG